MEGRQWRTVVVVIAVARAVHERDRRPQPRRVGADVRERAAVEAVRRARGHARVVERVQHGEAPERGEAREAHAQPQVPERHAA